jgi:signal-transduction protein with cAMP-binding, CBS, and nucleotidyltransferase domain
LQDLPFFAKWSKTQLNKVMALFKTVRFQRGQILFKEGVPNEDIYIVRSGEFSAVRTMVLKNCNINQSVIQYLRGQKTNNTLRSVFNPQFNSLTKAQSITNASKTKESM